MALIVSVEPADGREDMLLGDATDVEGGAIELQLLADRERQLLEAELWLLAPDFSPGLLPVSDAAFSPIVHHETTAALAVSTPPRRLRVGSNGDRVRKLQTRLGIAAPDGDFGPATPVALHALQKVRAAGKPDAIYSPELDQAPGWSSAGA